MRPPGMNPLCGPSGRLFLGRALCPLYPFLGRETGDRIKEFAEALVGVDDHIIRCRDVGFGVDDDRLAAGTDRHVKAPEGPGADAVSLLRLLGLGAKTVLQLGNSPRLKVLREPAFDGV